MDRLHNSVRPSNTVSGDTGDLDVSIIFWPFSVAGIEATALKWHSGPFPTDKNAIVDMDGDSIT
jgi:hypothetical protein